MENAKKGYDDEELEENRRRPRRRRRRASARRRRRAAPRRRAGRRRMRRNPTHVVFAGNPWTNDRAGHRRAARKGWRAKKRRGGRRRSAARRRGRARRSAPRRRRRRDELAMLENPGMLENPSFLPNQLAGAFSRANLMAYGTAAAGVAVGLLVADFVDRYVATRKPADAASGATANNPWYGRDAAAAQRMRPDAWRLGTQAAGAVVALGLAYWTRGSRLIPWLLGGTAIGFGANLLKMLADWWLMPAILKTKADNEASFANRMYPLEQAAIQDQVTEIFANWDKTESLNAGQQTTPDIRSPLTGAAAGGTDVYTLGRANVASRGVGANGRFFKNTGRLGNCTSCGGYNGCWSDCSTQCPDCPGYNPHKKCTYTVQMMGEIEALAAQSGVTMSDVASMNGGRTSFAVGETVTLPYGMCMIIETRGVPAGIPQPVPPSYVPLPTPIPSGGPTVVVSPPTMVPPGAYMPITGVPQQNGNGSDHAQSPGVQGNGHKPATIFNIGVQDE